MKTTNTSRFFIELVFIAITPVFYRLALLSDKEGEAF
jgi:hypothetical protein